MSDLSIFFTQYKGELAALCAALFWALASVVYQQVGQNIPPLLLNLIKGTIALGFLILTLGIMGNRPATINAISLTLLLLSGIIGIGLGDTVYFAAINHLGARNALLLESLAPPITALLSLVFLQENLPITAWCGILLTVFGVAWVVTEQVSHNGTLLKFQGVSLGVVAALAQASGAILSRAALVQTEIHPLWSALFRLAAGVLTLLCWGVFKQQHRRFPIKTLFSMRVLGAILLATILGTYLGLWLQQTSLKFTTAGVAQTLSATSPLFALPIAILLGETVSRRAVFGVIIAVLGIALLLGL